MSENFGPLARRTTSRNYGGSVTQSVLNTSIFTNSWRAQGEDARGGRFTAEYTMLPPSGGKAYFHMLLDASGSTWKRVSIGNKKRVWEHLLKNFEQLVESADTFRPHDVICVWTFNKRTKLLCRVEQKNFHAQLEAIRAKYEEEFVGMKKTCLYDAVATVMKTIREEYEAHKTADFFLVTFTDGKDNTSEFTTLDSMMDDHINGIDARLHTFFITANMPPGSDLYHRLLMQECEITLIDCVKTEPVEISDAFNKLRELIKVYLVVRHQRERDSELVYVTRVADYAANAQDAAERMMSTLQILPRETSLLDGLSGMKRSIGFAP